MSIIDVSLIILLLIVGFFTGILSGLLGIGGGVIFVPTLLFVLPQIGIENSTVVVSAIATSLMAGSFASASSVFNHQKKGNILWKEGFLLGIGTLISASLAPNLIVSLNPTTLKVIISFFILIVAINLLFSKPQITSKEKSISSFWLFPFGLFFGGIAALSGLGGGIFYVPILLLIVGGDIKVAVGTSSLVILITMLSSTISFAVLDHNWQQSIYQLGYLNILSGILLGIGAIIGAYFGVKLILKVPATVLRKIFSVFLLIVVIKIMVGVLK